MRCGCRRYDLFDFVKQGRIVIVHNVFLLVAAEIRTCWTGRFSVVLGQCIGPSLAACQLCKQRQHMVGRHRRVFGVRCSHRTWNGRLRPDRQRYHLQGVMAVCHAELLAQAQFPGAGKLPAVKPSSLRMTKWRHFRAANHLLWVRDCGMIEALARIVPSSIIRLLNSAIWHSKDSCQCGLAVCGQCPGTAGWLFGRSLGRSLPGANTIWYLQLRARRRCAFHASGGAGVERYRHTGHSACATGQR